MAEGRSRNRAVRDIRKEWLASDVKELPRLLVLLLPRWL